jgi:hypothetical protein
MRASLARDAIANRLAFQDRQRTLCLHRGELAHEWASLAPGSDCQVSAAHWNRAEQFIRRQQDPLSRSGPHRRARPRPRQSRLGRRDRRRLVAGGDSLHPRGRGQREAVLRGDSVTRVMAPSALAKGRLLDGERSFHSGFAMPGNGAEVGVGAWLQFDHG